MQLDNKVVVVTGAESGIGREIALSCAEAGANLVLSGLSEDGLQETAAALRSRTGLVPLVQLADITDPQAITVMLDEAGIHFGKVDAVVANAGIMTPQKPLIEVSADEWHRSISVNLTGTFNTVQAAARLLIKQGAGGSILATGSSTAIRGMSGLSAYVSAKAGIHGLMRILALELAAHRIRVNTLVPGTTATALAQSIPGHLERAAQALPLGEAVSPRELGRYVAFALSDALPHMTGSLLTVDSGRIIA